MLRHKLLNVPLETEKEIQGAEFFRLYVQITVQLGVMICVPKMVLLHYSFVYVCVENAFEMKEISIYCRCFHLSQLINCSGAVNEAREANLNEITEVQQSLQETKDTIAALKKQLNEIHDHDAVLK